MIGTGAKELEDLQWGGGALGAAVTETGLGSRRFLPKLTGTFAGGTMIAQPIGIIKTEE